MSDSNPMVLEKVVMHGTNKNILTKGGQLACETARKVDL